MINNVLIILLTSLLTIFIALNQLTNEKRFSIFYFTIINIAIASLFFYKIITVNKLSPLSMLIYIIVISIIIVSSFIFNKFTINNIEMLAIVNFLSVISTGFVTRLNEYAGVKQVFMILIGYVFYFSVIFIYPKYKKIRHISVLLLIVSITLMIFTNTEKFGSNNWLNLYIVTIQPSEFTKVFYPLFIGSLFSIYDIKIKNKLIILGSITTVIIGIVVFKNDFGTALLFFALFFLMGYVFTMNRYVVISGFVLSIIGGTITLKFVTHVQNRMLAWIRPYSYADTMGYQIIKSIEAFKTGGLIGRGIYNGSPTKIPVVISDFIMAGIGEELGGVFVILVLILFLLLAFITIDNLLRITSNFDFYVASAIIILFMFQMFVIVGGITNLIPLTGVTMPFISYGGSSMVGSFISLGIITKIIDKGGEVANKPFRNRPLTRIKGLFFVMVGTLIINLMIIIL